ncbi:nucleotidyltransferase-like protein [Keratinibaculum paraultunense]|uniref:Nucleotidyltransferase-like protein n=2 Tax=Keratinibaculum paraultunense TaxID=1278232 RepID=A0A4R3L052_9FIRM|nr:nucleotidyltransferase-like protein [Keratinibaculum paraultunense]
MKGYLEFQQLIVKSLREAIKQAYQIELIDHGHTWIDALADRNLTVHTYDEDLVKKWLKIFPLFTIHNLRNYMKNWLRN